MDVVRTAAFDRTVRKLGASDAALEALFASLAADPEAGDVIQGLRGARKVRFAMKGKGKSGGGRAVYVFARSAGVVILILAYDKSVQADLSNRQRQAVLAVMESLFDD